MNIKSGVFNFNDVRSCDRQYKIRHTDTNEFKIGEQVFLKAYPEFPMIVKDIRNNKIICECEDVYGNISLESFPPECILQYKYNCLEVWKKKYDICIS